MNLWKRQKAMKWLQCYKFHKGPEQSSKQFQFPVKRKRLIQCLLDLSHWGRILSEVAFRFLSTRVISQIFLWKISKLEFFQKELKLHGNNERDFRNSSAPMCTWKKIVRPVSRKVSNFYLMNRRYSPDVNDSRSQILSQADMEHKQRNAKQNGE